MKVFNKNLVASLIALALMVTTIIFPLTGSAMAASQRPQPITFATMSNKLDAAAKDAEGRLESAYGELTGDAGHQIKGKGKQVQATAMNVAADLQQGAESVAKNVKNSAEKVADDVS